MSCLACLHPKIALYFARISIKEWKHTRLDKHKDRAYQLLLQAARTNDLESQYQLGSFVYHECCKSCHSRYYFSIGEYCHKEAWQLLKHAKDKNHVKALNLYQEISNLRPKWQQMMQFEERKKRREDEAYYRKYHDVIEMNRKRNIKIQEEKQEKQAKLEQYRAEHPEFVAMETQNELLQQLLLQKQEQNKHLQDIETSINVDSLTAWY